MHYHLPAFRYILIIMQHFSHCVYSVNACATLFTFTFPFGLFSFQVLFSLGVFFLSLFLVFVWGNLTFQFRKVHAETPDMCLFSHFRLMTRAIKH